MTDFIGDATFGERFGFARWWQALVHREESDADFAAVVERSQTQIGEYHSAAQAPNSSIWPRAAERMGVDLRWLSDNAEPPASWPDRNLFLTLFARWLATRRAPSVPAAPPRKVKVTRLDAPAPTRVVKVDRNKKAAPEKGGQRGKKTGS